MNNIYYLAQIVEDIGGTFSDCEFVGVFTTRKNAEDAICKILSGMCNKTIDYTDSSAEADFLDEHSNDYMIDEIRLNKSYY